MNLTVEVVVQASQASGMSGTCLLEVFDTDGVAFNAHGVYARWA
jgi:hypothetical protein